MKTIIGIDNGVSGTIGVLKGQERRFFKIPIIRYLDYQKTKRYLNRVNVKSLRKILKEYYDDEVFVVIERPMVNPTRFKATVSALRCLEAILICVESFDFSYRFIDSKEWQREFFPKKIKGSDQLKEASFQIGKRMFPKIFNEGKFKDADGMLIAEYARRKWL